MQQSGMLVNSCHSIKKQENVSGMATGVTEVALASTKCVTGIGMSDAVQQQSCN